MIKAFLRKVGLLSKGVSTRGAGNQPVIIPRDKHKISRKQISENALKVLYRLHRNGYEAYLVGGGVRDLLLGSQPKDFDVVTNAKPDDVRRIFRNCRLIGRRFRLAHVYFGYDIIEVATFRGKALEANEDHKHSEEGMILRDNVYGTLAEDVMRRDFTINALYYNIADFSLVDYVGGMADLQAKRLKIIGDPDQRFREDPVRMLRAIRFACKTGFKLTPELKQSIQTLKSLILNVSSSRLYEEVIKMFHSGRALEAYSMLNEENLFEMLFPATYSCLSQKDYPTDGFLRLVFENTDLRLKEDKSLHPSFIIAALLWHPICIKGKSYTEKNMAMFPARTKALEETLSEQIKHTSMPKRISQAAREIWLMQLRLEKRQSRRVNDMMAEQRFRAAYDFLELRAKAGESVKEAAQWWREYIEGDAKVRKTLLASLGEPRKRKRSRKRPVEKRKEE
jgi:poly(A) polymerase